MKDQSLDLDEILETLLENFNHPPELYRYLEAQAFEEAKAAIEAYVNERVVAELENILLITSRGDLGVDNAYETDFVLGSLLKDRIKELKK